MVRAMTLTAMEDSAGRVRGCLLLIAGVFCFSLLDTTAKVLVVDYPVGQLVWVRNLGGLIFVLAFALPRHGIAVFRTKHPYLQGLRGLLLVASTAVNFIALSYLPLATNAAILYTAPLLICALSVPILGEQVGWRRWSAISAGFLGAMIVVRPGFAGFHWAVLFSCTAALFIAVYSLATRQVAARDSSYTSLVYVSVIGTIAATPFAFLEWQTPHGWDLLLFCLLGVFGSLGHYLLIVAHGLAPASVLAPFTYAQIISVALLGYLVFDHIPDAWVWLGAAVISASGLYLGYRERRVKGLG